MDDLRRMAIFVAVVEQGSFSGAAVQLGMSRSGVSKQIGLLEERYDVRLLNRTTRTLSTTEAGQVFFVKSRTMLDWAQEAVADLEMHKDTPRGTLRVAAPLGLGEALVARGLGDFLAEHPQVRVDLVLSDEYHDLVRDQIDVAIRAGPLPDSALVARKITSIPLVLAASARYLAAHSAPTTIKELREHRWVGFTPLERDGQLVLRGEGGAVSIPLPRSRASTNHGPVLLTLLLQDLGIGCLPEFFVQSALEQGELERVLPSMEAGRVPIYATFAKSRHTPPKIRAFVEFMVKRVG